MQYQVSPRGPVALLSGEFHDLQRTDMPNPWPGLQMPGRVHSLVQ